MSASDIPHETDAGVAPAPVVEPVSLGSAGRDRLRLLALVAMVCVWLYPTWVQADVGGLARPEIGATRTGIAGALGLLALWGLASTSLAARSRRGLRIGAAITDAIVALLVSSLLLQEHPWIPGDELREAWVPIYLPLALLAALDAGAHAARGSAAPQVTFIRAGAALFATVALVTEASWIPAAIALWLAISPLAFLRTSTGAGTRRALELLILVAGVVAGLSPWIQKSFVGVHEEIGATLTLPIYGWAILAALLVTTALEGLMRPEAEATAPGAR